MLPDQLPSPTPQRRRYYCPAFRPKRKGPGKVGEMLGASYRRRLADDLPRWSERGWVTPEGGAAILASFDERRSTLGLSAVVGGLGAILLGLGVLAFVAANWEEMPRLLRFGLLVGGMGGSYAAAALLDRRGLPALSDAAVMLAGFVFAGAIALIGQTYHLSGDFADALLLWTAGCLGAAFLTRSPGATVLALAGSAYWTWLVTVEAGNVPHWGGLGAVLLAGAVATMLWSRFARLCAVAALLFWLTVTVGAAAEGLDWTLAGALALGAQMALLLWAAGVVLASLRGRGRVAALGEDALWPAVATLLGCLAVLQLTRYFGEPTERGAWIPLCLVALVLATGLGLFAWLRRRIALHDVAAVGLIGASTLAYAAAPLADGFGSRLVGGVLVLGAVLWAVILGEGGRNRFGKVTGLLAFALEVLYLYVVTLGTVLDTALAFLLGGVLFIGLSYLLLRIDRRLLGRTKAPGATQRT